MEALSRPTVEALRKAQGTILEHALDRVSASHAFYRTLSPTARQQIDSVAGLGVSMFVDAVDDPGHAASPGKIFSIAPAALTGTITLEQTLDLVRTVVDVVEEEAPGAVTDEDHDEIRIAVLSFGRDIGFAAAQVYARAAEARGAWDARLESVAVDAMLHDSSEDAASRAGSAGWRGSGPVVAIAARSALDALATSRLRHEARHAAQDCLVSVRGDSVIIILGGDPALGTEDPCDAAKRLDAAAASVAESLDGAAVIGHVVGGVDEAGQSLRAALAGLRALPGWSEAPNPVHADDLLPERLIAADPLAPERITALVGAPLAEMGSPFEETVATYLALGGSLEGTARALFVHANTVRYRLGRVSDQVGWDATDPRDGLVLHMAVIVGRLQPGAGRAS